MFVLYKTEILTKVKAKYKIMKGEAVSYTSKAALLTTSTVASLVALMASRGALSSLASVSTALTTFFLPNQRYPWIQLCIILSFHGKTITNGLDKKLLRIRCSFYI